MSTPEGTGAGRPLRTSGFVLLGLAAVAALIGLLAIATGGEQTDASQLPVATSTSQSAADEPPTTLILPTPTSPPGILPTPTSPPGSTPATSLAPLPAAPDPADDPAAPAAPGTDTGVVGGPPDYRGEARIYNNSTISGLASRAADDLNAAGWTVVEVANYSGGRIPTSTVYYQEGTDQRATAEAIGAHFGIRVEPRFDGIANARPGVIVIVTNDYGT
ncbi:MAG: LytR C-terminal domain-containing protein [Pseudonocardiales bacterium]